MKHLKALAELEAAVNKAILTAVTAQEELVSGERVLETDSWIQNISSRVQTLYKGMQALVDTAEAKPIQGELFPQKKRAAS